MQPTAIPDWAARLGATPGDPTPAKWSRWTTQVPTYAVTFDALNPKRNKAEWKEHWPEEYGKVMLRPLDGSDRSTAEIEVVKAFVDVEWHARWIDTFHQSPAWMRPWTRATDEGRAVSEHLRAIRAASPMSRPWDVVAWRGDEFLFIECKADNEKFTDAEQAFIWGAQNIGIALNRFAVVRGSINLPPRPPA